MTDRCEVSDLPRSQCAHCGAAPGVRLTGYLAAKAQRVTVVRRGGRDVFPSAVLSMPTRTTRTAVGMSDSMCTTCGGATRDDAYGCDACTDELRMTFADAPWWAEQIEITMTKQQAKRPGAGGRGSVALPFRDDAATLAHGLRAHLVSTVRLCARDHVRNSSPYVGLPEDTIEAMSRWLLWRVDGLALHQGFDEILTAAQRIETLAAWLIDRRPDRLFLGKCKWAMVCGGVVFAKAGDAVAKCRACGEEYDVAERRAELEKALDDQLVTAAEIAKLATYLGIAAPRDVIRKRVNRWHNKGEIKAAGFEKAADGKTERAPRFRYGDVAPRLAATYERKD